ncbi:MAG: hypothetical protein KGL35_17145 [Bradyrhizobium sp.]|nr:hypothetical protein [Bradyrhizobium sp.]
MMSSDLLVEPWRSIPGATVPLPEGRREAQLLADPVALEAGADQIVAARVLRAVANNIREGRVSALPSRLTEKLTKAAGVLARRVAASESRADALIAREAALAKREDEAFSPHEAAATSLEKQYDMVERNYDILGNGSLVSSEHSDGSGA